MGSSRPRKKTKRKTDRTFSEADKQRTKFLEQGSLYNQPELEKKMEVVNVDNQALSSSSSRSKLLGQGNDSVNNNSVTEDGSTSNDSNSRDETLDQFIVPDHDWIINIHELECHLHSVAVCISCGGGLDIYEERALRAGLATKLHFLCRNDKCEKHSSGFYTSMKTGKSFDINTKLTLGGRLAGKGRSGLDKLTAVLGLSRRGD